MNYHHVITLLLVIAACWSPGHMLMTYAHRKIMVRRFMQFGHKPESTEPWRRDPVCPNVLTRDGEVMMISGPLPQDREDDEPQRETA